MFAKIKDFFKKRLYTKAQIRMFVVRGVITPEQYKLITGDDYE